MWSIDKLIDYFYNEFGKDDYGNYTIITKELIKKTVNRKTLKRHSKKYYKEV
jgi:hypothetical protein